MPRRSRQRRKKLNKSLLLKAGAVVLVCGLVAVAAHNFHGSDNGDNFLHSGIAFVTQGKPDEGVSSFQHALALNLENGDLLVDSGDAINKCTYQDPKFLNCARSLWERAAQLTPPCRAALDRLFASYSEGAEITPSKQVFQSLADTAQKLLAVDPNDTDAIMALHRAGVEAWLFNPSPFPADDAEAAKHISALTSLIAQGTGDASARACLARVKIKQGIASRAGKQPDADAKFAQAAALFDPPAGANDAATQFRAFEICALLNKVASKPIPISRLTGYLNNAMVLSKPTDALFVQIRLIAAANAEEQKDRDRILDDLAAACPDDWSVRLAKARILSEDQTQHQQAVVLLDNPNAPHSGGPRGVFDFGNQLQAKIDQADLRMDLADYTTDAVQHQKLLEQVTESLSWITARTGSRPEVLALDARLQLGMGKTVEAIRELRGALQSPKCDGTRFDVFVRYRLALAWMKLGQTGDARPLLEDILQHAPRFALARIALARALLADNLFDDATPQVEELERQLPGRPEVIKLQEFLDGRQPTHLVTDASSAIDSDEVSNEIGLSRQAALKGDTAGALQHLQSAQQMAPNNVRVLEQAFAYYIWRKNWDQAKTYCAQLVAANADQINGLSFQFKLAMVRKDFPTATATAQEMTRKFPELASCWYAAGQADQAVSLFNSASDHYTQTLQKQPTHAGALKGIVECYYAESNPLMASGAIARARQARPHDPEFFQMQIQYESKYETPQAALSARRDEFVQHPDDPNAALALSSACLRAEDNAANSSQEDRDNVAAAEESLKAAQANAPDVSALNIAVADLLAHDGNPDAVTFFRKVLEKSPDDVAVLNDIACVLVDDLPVPRTDEALGYSQHAIEIEQKANAFNSAIWDTRGWVLISAGQVDDGMRLLEQVETRSPTPAARYHMAQGLLKTSQPEEALQQLKQAMLLIDADKKNGRDVDIKLASQITTSEAHVTDLITHPTASKVP